MKLNVCSGHDYREGYINIDFSDLGSDGKTIKVDKKWNLLTEPSPYPDNSADEIVFRESLEHFNRHNGLAVLKKLYSILKPGGVFDITVPPAKKQLKIFMMQMDNVKHIDDFLYAHERFTPLKWHDDLMGATHLSDGTDGDSHKVLFSPNMLRVVLEYVGFKIVSMNENIDVICTK